MRPGWSNKTTPKALEGSTRLNLAKKTNLESTSKIEFGNT
jgi:hypothetical protein